MSNLQCLLKTVITMQLGLPFEHLTKFQRKSWSSIYLRCSEDLKSWMPQRDTHEVDDSKYSWRFHSSWTKHSNGYLLSSSQIFLEQAKLYTVTGNLCSGKDLPCFTCFLYNATLKLIGLPTLLISCNMLLYVLKWLVAPFALDLWLYSSHQCR